MSSRAYVKLIDKIQGQIDDVRQDICYLEDINLLSFFLLTVGKILHPTKTEEIFTQIEEIYNRLNQLRGRLRSALNTYAIASTAENQQSQTQHQTEDSEKQAFFSNLMGLLEQINFLEHELRRKDIRYFVNQTNNETSTLTQNADSQKDIDWEDLKLKF
ncbi:hypothetical protein H6G27_33630 [Nostoc linckia FACHB-104]|nr:hypothetical protein [Nostoc linckia FACHB-104]